MFASYFTTARRVIMRNKLFSFINIFGLAASMSVGLLFIAILHDVMRFDAFHEKSERIVRVITDYRESSGNSIMLASSSMSLGTEIRAGMPEAESVTTVCHGFGGDFQSGKTILPLKGFWADAQFFDVFSFELLSGDSRTALNNPNAIILTETSATKIFGTRDVLGKTLAMKSDNSTRNHEYIITGVMKDIPKYSHLQFEALGSRSTLTAEATDMLDWSHVWSNYTYVILSEGATTQQLSSSLDRLAEQHNKTANDGQGKIFFGLQPLKEIVFFGKMLDNQAGPTMPTRFLWLISGLSIVVLITACFNYTNLSLARASRRLREVGIRKVIGSKRRQLLAQFIAESTVISLIALVFALLAFLFIRSHFLLLTPNLYTLFELQLTPIHIIIFIAFAMMIGLLSGILPGMFFSRVNVASLMRGFMSSKVTGRFGTRKAFIVFQYVFALMFITSTVILYKQYRAFVTYDLGFNTNNIVNIKLQGNNADVVESKLSTLAEVNGVSRAMIVTSTGNNYYTHVKYDKSPDSLRAWYNKIDERYLNLLNFKIVAGRNFVERPVNAPETDVIVNRKLLASLNIKGNDPVTAIGETITVEGQRLTIVGVVEDFHYSTLDNAVGPFLFRQLGKPQVLNVNVTSADMQGTIAKISELWRQIDEIHPLQAELYDHQLEFTYRQYSSIGKVVGFLAALTIVISSLGLLGMVVFSAETRMKEMGIRRVMGARLIDVTFLLSRNFIFLLLLSAIIAIPATWFFFTYVVLTNVVYHNPIGLIELFAGATFIGVIALAMVISQAASTTRKELAEVLRSE